MKQITVLGCGWLGLPLAKSLIGKGFSVKGSTTSLDKISVLENAGIEAFQLAIGESQIDGTIESLLENSAVLIIDIPPKLRGNSSESFVKKIEVLVPFIQKSSVEKIIFISSTAVYGDHFLIVDETTQAQPDTESGKQLLEAENLLQSNFKTTIVRFGGLIGEDRHPVFHLAGKQDLANAQAPVNLIHQDDCIGIIETIIELECWNEVFNAVAPFHPTRKVYYTQKAQELGLPLPHFTEAGTSSGKKILSGYLQARLGYQFQNSHL